MPTETIKRFVVFTNDLNFSVRTGIRGILDAFGDVSVDVLVHQPKRKPSQLVRSQFRNIKKHGISWIPYQAKGIGSRTFFRDKPHVAGQGSRPGGRYEIEEMINDGRVRVTVSPTVNGRAAQRLLEELSPDLGLSLGAPILKERVFGIPRLGTINLHKGKVPEYRGMPPAFWEILNGETSVGCTVHKVLKTLDSGPVWAEGEVPIEAYSTPAGIGVRLDTLGNKLLVDGIRRIQDGLGYVREQKGPGNTNSRPPLPLERKLLRSLSDKEGTRGNAQRRKDLLLTGYSSVRATGRMLKPTPSREKVAVLLYHRVNDALRDSVTVGIERFDQHMAYLKRHWSVVSLRDVVQGNVETDSRRPLVCVTFDDGYRDNYDYAAPILVKHRLPATFFVCTGNMTHQRPFEHDIEKGVLGLPNMSWDQAREMQDDGLDFGSHTVNHTNMGQTTSDQARTELVESRETLRNELGHKDFLFAYPFGGQLHITPQVIDMVRETGYMCCCSAYGGGANKQPLDKFNILRTGINYNFSLPALRARINGWK